MSQTLTRELVTKGLGSETHKVSLRGGRYTLYVRPMRIGETIEFVNRVSSEDASESDKLDAMVDIALQSCVDEDGNPLFEASDRELVLSQFTAQDLSKLVEAIADIEMGDIEGKSPSSNGAIG